MPTRPDAEAQYICFLNRLGFAWGLYKAVQILADINLHIPKSYDNVMYDATNWNINEVYGIMCRVHFNIFNEI